MTPDYFIHNGNLFPCVGSDDGKFWAETPEGIEAVGFDKNECTPLYEQPIPVNQDDDMTFKEMLLGLFNVDFMTSEEFNTICDAGEMYAKAKQKFLSSPSPTPVNEKEVQAEWEFLIIMRENYEAAKRGSEEDFAGTTKKEAVIEIYEDLIDIIKNLPLKRSGKEQEVIDYVNNLPQPSTPVQEGLREDEINPETGKPYFSTLDPEKFKKHL